LLDFGYFAEIALLFEDDLFLVGLFEPELAMFTAWARLCLRTILFEFNG
jgi:hypothetical protein